MLKRQEIEPSSLRACSAVNSASSASAVCRDRNRFADFSGEVRGIGKGVDQCKLVGAIQQRLLFVLAMDIEKGRSQFAQRRNGARLIVDVNPIPFVSGNLPANHDLVDRRSRVQADPVGLTSASNTASTIARFRRSGPYPRRLLLRSADPGHRQ